MLSKFKFNLRDLLVGLLILSPVIFLGYKAYNPAEAKLVKMDEEKRDTINIIARGIEPYFKENKVYPDCPEKDWAVCFKDLQVLDFTPANAESYTYKTSESLDEIIIYIEAKSLEWKEFCHVGTAYILYSSVDNKTEISCTDSPVPGKQKFVN